MTAAMKIMVRFKTTSIASSKELNLYSQFTLKNTERRSSGPRSRRNQ